MQYSGLFARLVFAATTASACGIVLAQQSPVGPAASSREAPAALRSPTVNLRLSPDLGDDLPTVRAALLGLGPLRLAEPADYEITSKADFPQSLIAIDAQQPREHWQNDFTADPVRPAPRTVELGNLALGDFTARLGKLVQRRDRANRLMALALGNRPAGVETCLVAHPSTALPDNCHRGAARPAAEGQSSPDEMDGESFFTASLHNRSRKPLYVALLAVDPSSGITRIPLKDVIENRPLAPGVRAATDMLPSFGNSSGYVALVTLSSDRPIDTRAIEQVGFDDPAWDDCLETSAGCVRSTTVFPSDWAVSIAEYQYAAPHLVGIGGGMSVLEGMAPWMVEIYSTVPFTSKDIEDDSKAPEHKRKFLAQRSRAERDHRCGGALIGENLVLTAAHCVANDPFAGPAYPGVLKDRRVRVATKRLGRGGTTLAIAGVAVPANYVAGRQENDIALLLLRPDRATKRFSGAAIRPGEKPISQGTDVTAYGWGYTGAVAPGKDPLIDISGELQRNPDMLRFGRMRALGWSACRRRLKDKLGSGMVCLVAPGAESGATPDKNVFSCRGDSGGPLVREIGNAEELVGVTSWSLGCGHRDIPSVYTDVTKYRRWIAAAKQQLRPGAALRVDEKAAPLTREGRRQSGQ